MDNKKIAEIKSRQSIMLANYTPSYVVATSRVRGYSFNPAVNGEPSYEFVSFDELYDINMKTRAIKNGLLIIADDEADDIYEILGITNWRDTIISEDKIEEMATNTSLANQKKIVAIKETSTIERLRAKYTQLVNNRDERASYIIGDLIDRRYREIINNQTYTNIKVDEPAEEVKSEIKRLKDEIKGYQSLKEELDKYKELNEELRQVVMSIKGEQSASKKRITKK